MSIEDIPYVVFQGLSFQRFAVQVQLNSNGAVGSLTCIIEGL